MFFQKLVGRLRLLLLRLSFISFFRILSLFICLFLSTGTRFRAWHFVSLLDLRFAVLFALKTLFDVFDASLLAESVLTPEFRLNGACVEEH